MASSSGYAFPAVVDFSGDLDKTRVIISDEELIDLAACRGILPIIKEYQFKHALYTRYEIVLLSHDSAMP